MSYIDKIKTLLKREEKIRIVEKIIEPVSIVYPEPQKRIEPEKPKEVVKTIIKEVPQKKTDKEKVKAWYIQDLTELNLLLSIKEQLNKELLRDNNKLVSELKKRIQYLKNKLTKNDYNYKRTNKKSNTSKH